MAIPPKVDQIPRTGAPRYRHVVAPTPGSSNGVTTAWRYPGVTRMSLSASTKTSCFATVHMLARLLTL